MASALFRDGLGDEAVAYMRRIDLDADIRWVAERLPPELEASFFHEGEHTGWRMNGTKWTWARLGEDVTSFLVHRRDGRRIDRSPASTATVERIRRGWPFAALEGVSWTPGSLLPVRDRLIVIGEGTARPLRLPTRPLWLGLLGDVLALGAVAWVFAELPGAAERWVRRRRGRCWRCGHTLAGAARCPECGSE